MTYRKQKLVNHIMIGTTLLSGINPVLASADGKMSDQSPQSEMVVESNETSGAEKKEDGRRRKKNSSISDSSVIQQNQNEEIVNNTQSIKQEDEKIIAIPNSIKLLNWSGIDIELSEGILNIPEGTLNNPESLSTMLRRQGIDLKSIEEINFNGKLQLIGSVAGLFSGLTQLNQINGLQQLDTSEVTNMSSLFSDCISLSSIDLSTFETSKVTRMDHMFFACQSLVDVDLTSLETGNVTLLNHMFQSATNLRSVDMSSFDTSKVKDIEIMFADCQNLEEVKFGPGWDTSNVAYFYAVFYNCQKLKHLDLSMFKTQNVSSMDRMFANCFNLEEIILGEGWDTSKVKSFYAMFVNNTSLKSLDVSTFTLSSATSISLMFAGCTMIEQLDLRGFNNQNLGTSAPSFFEEMFNLKEIYLPENFIFHGKGSENLSEPPQDDIFTGFWKHIGTGTVTNPNGARFSSAELMNNFDEDYAGTWIWERYPGEVVVQHLGDDGSLLQTEKINGYRGLEYKTQAQNFEGYQWNGYIPEQASGIFSKDTPTIIYTYKKEKSLIEQLDISASPIAEWLNEYNSNTLKNIQLTVINKASDQVLNFQELEKSGITLSMSLTEAAHLGENKVKIILNDGEKTKEVFVRLFLAQPKILVTDSKFVKPSEIDNHSLINELSQSTLSVHADFGTVNPPKELESLEINNFKAYTFKNNILNVEITTGRTSVTNSVKGALLEGDDSWKLSEQRHYGVDINHPTYIINSKEHLGASHDTLSKHIDLYQATQVGKQQLDTSRTSQTLSFENEHVQNLKDKNTLGSHRITFAFGHNEGDSSNKISKSREGAGELIVGLVNDNILNTPKDLVPIKDNISTFSNKNFPKNIDSNTRIKTQKKLGDFGDNKQGHLRIGGLLALIGSVILYIFKRRK